jgi:uncharacterized protein GlcG (DUF336 family)
MNGLTFESAQKMAERAVSMAREKFQRPVCVAVCDHFGFLMAFARMDGAPVRSIQISQSKAYTAARMGVPTHDFLARIQRENVQPGYFCDPLLTALPGGSVLRNQNGEMIGGIGVSALAPFEDQKITETIAAESQAGAL